jgi:allantoicase
MEGIIDRIIVDTKHFIGNAPRAIVVHGCSITDQVPLKIKRESKNLTSYS